jgi:ATP-dependent DNA helicase RecQ
LALASLKGTGTGYQSLLNKQNTFVIMPTGGGNRSVISSRLVQETAIVCFSIDRFNENQVDAIRSLSTESVCPCFKFITHKTEIAQVKRYYFWINEVVVCCSGVFDKEENVSKNVTISFVAIDEAHCISSGVMTLGGIQKFKNIIKQLGDVPVIGLTATAT